MLLGTKAGKNNRQDIDSLSEADHLSGADEELESSHLSSVNITKRKFSRVIRYRNYDMTDLTNFRREMVTQYVPFRNELVDIIDRNKFLEIFDDNFDLIT